MRIAYFDCASGIAGDMTLGALVDAGADLAAIQAGINSLGLAACQLSIEYVKKHGFRAAQLRIQHQPEHKHRHLHHITQMIDGSVMTPRAKELATRIFTRLGEAEAKVHGTTIAKVHFHEVGAVDSIADICGSAIALDLLGIERVVCSPVATGHGYVEIAHGRVSIPAPATAELLAGIPLAACEVEAELTTPTGAAILAALAESFGPVPAMTISKIGYGAGNRDLATQPNLLRVFIGEANDNALHANLTEHVTLLETNFDDFTGEEIGQAMSLLFAAGALDVTTTAIGMKKNRPGVLLSVLCRPADADRLTNLLLCETTTLGVRRSQVQRVVLPRRKVTVPTPWGEVTGKVVLLPEGGERFSPEFEDCRRLAESQGLPLREVQTAARQAFAAQRGDATSSS